MVVRMDSPDISVRLRRQADLFEAPAIAPYEGRYSRIPGIQWLIEEVEDLGLRRHDPPPRVTLAMPGPADGESVRLAIRGYCDEQIEESRWQLKMLRRSGFEALRIGLVLLAVCVLLSTTVGYMSFLPEYIRLVVSESLAIAGGVSLWRPLELLGFDTWPLIGQVQVLEKLRAADIRVVETDQVEGAARPA
jgi:hypothetical protein